MDEILERFVEQAPVAVMVQATAARAIGASVLDDIFERNAQSQFTRELTFNTVARLMTQVVFRTHCTVNAAYRANAKEIPVSVTPRLQQARWSGNGNLAGLGCRDG
jgi:hypothetical protein